MISQVLSSLCHVPDQLRHVSISKDGVASAASKIVQQLPEIKENAAGFDTELHYCDGGPLTAQYLLVVDTLNFCFWPDGELEYEHLAGGIKASVLQDPRCIDADRLANITGAGVRQLIGWHRDLPQQEERARLLREVGSVLQQHFKGQAAELIAAAQQSAVGLVQLVASHFPGFRDHCIYRGRQVFFYKRAQIFVGDVYGAFKGTGLGCFQDIDQLTMFADYRVPVVLRVMGVLQYSQALADKVDSGLILPSGSEEEIDLRAASVLAVEQLKHAANALLQARHGQGQSQQQDGPSSSAGVPASSAEDAAELSAKMSSSSADEVPQLLSIQLDWWLWQEGERERSKHPHHKTWTIYY